MIGQVRLSAGKSPFETLQPCDRRWIMHLIACAANVCRALSTLFKSMHLQTQHGQVHAGLTNLEKPARQHWLLPRHRRESSAIAAALLRAPRTSVKLVTNKGHAGKSLKLKSAAFDSPLDCVAFCVFSSTSASSWFVFTRPRSRHHVETDRDWLVGSSGPHLLRVLWHVRHICIVHRYRLRDQCA